MKATNPGDPITWTTYFVAGYINPQISISPMRRTPSRIAGAHKKNVYQYSGGNHPEYSFLTLFIAVYFFIMKTKMGKAIRAASQDREAAEVVGINISTVNSAVFMIGGALSGTAAVLISPLYSVFPTMGDLPLLKSLVVVILGGFGSVAGVLIGGLGLGIVESLGGVYISAAYQHGFTFFVLILVLLFFPRGLFGRV